MAFIDQHIVQRGIPRTHSGTTPPVMVGEEQTGVRKGFLDTALCRSMAADFPSEELPPPPPDFDDLIDWLEHWSTRLVLLEEYSLSDLGTAVAATERAVQDHRAEAARWPTSLGSLDADTERTLRLVLSDHDWFRISLEQLRWFLGVVEADDHGGHRQALGQFGRVLAEALRRHRVDERTLEGPLGSAVHDALASSRETLISPAARAREEHHA